MYFLHTLALAMGRTVAELLETTNAEELEAWRVYSNLFPFDDRHRYHRPAALIAASLQKSGNVDKNLDWLEPKPQLRPLKPMQVIKPKE